MRQKALISSSSRASDSSWQVLPSCGDLRNWLLPRSPVRGSEGPAWAGRSALCSFIVCCERIMCKSGIDKRLPREEEGEKERKWMRSYDFCSSSVSIWGRAFASPSKSGWLMKIGDCVNRWRSIGLRPDFTLIPPASSDKRKHFTIRSWGACQHGSVGVAAAFSVTVAGD